MPIDLQSELTGLRKTILTMGAAAEQRVVEVLEALKNRDDELAMKVRTGDNEIDALEIEVEQACLRILALGAPVAADLRFVLAAMHINTDFERVGDLAKSIAKRVLDLNTLKPKPLPDGLLLMGDRTVAMFSDSMVALSNTDSELARSVRRADQRVDDLNKVIFAWVQHEIPQDVEFTDAALGILSIARNLERIADHATNIAEEVMFLVDGQIARHSQV